MRPSCNIRSPRALDAEWKLGRTPYDSAGLEPGAVRVLVWRKVWATRMACGCSIQSARRFQNAPVESSRRRNCERWFSGKAAAESKWERPKYDGDAASRALDAITLEQHYIQHYGMTRRICREFLSPVEGGGSGLGPDALSAYNDFASDFLYPVRRQVRRTPVQMFPGGNTTIARLMVKTLIPRCDRRARRPWKA